MEQNLVSDEELIKRISTVLNDSKEPRSVEGLLVTSTDEKFHDVPDIILSDRNERSDLEIENQFLTSQLEAEKKKSRELQFNLHLFENSARYFEKLNGQLEAIKQSVEEESLMVNDQGDCGGRSLDAMQKLRPKTVHTASHRSGSNGNDDTDDGAGISSEPQTEKEEKHRTKKQPPVRITDVEDLKQFEENLAIVKDRERSNESDPEKVFITKTEKKWFEDIGNIASRIRTPLDDKHQKFFEKDRKRFVNRIVMPETQELDKSESVPAEIISKTKETPVNLTSTELDGLRSYLLQLKELIARRETAWARTTERDYNQRVEITRFKNEVSHLRMLCEKRQKDIKERDQIIVAKDEEIKDLQKKIQSLKNAMLKMERRDSENLDNVTPEAIENSHLVQKSYSIMKRATLFNRGLVNDPRNLNAPIQRTSSGKEVITKRIKMEKTPRKIKSTSSNSNDEDLKPSRAKSKGRTSPHEKAKNKRSEAGQPPSRRKTSLERVDEKLQRIEEMLHSDILKTGKKSSKTGERRSSLSGLSGNETDSPYQKFTLSNGKMRQEVLTAMAGLGGSGGMSGYSGPAIPTQKQPPFQEMKKSHGNAAILANALLAARNKNIMFNF